MYIYHIVFGTFRNQIDHWSPRKTSGENESSASKHLVLSVLSQLHQIPPVWRTRIIAWRQTGMLPLGPGGLWIVDWGRAAQRTQHQPSCHIHLPHITFRDIGPRSKIELEITAFECEPPVVASSFGGCPGRPFLNRIP